jgi:uncharacterized protein
LLQLNLSIVNFSNVIKPTHLCNLACSYCFNEDTRAPIMERKTLTRVVEQTFAFCETKPLVTNIDFIWHGGEPMIAGLDFFKIAVDLQSTYSRGAAFHNSLQTNGVLLNPDWVTFLKENKFRVSVSIDGPRHFHDKNRTYLSKRGSFDAVMRGIRLLQEAKIPLGVAVVISRDNKDHTEELYDFLAQERLPFNIIPLTRSGDALVNFNDVGLGPEEYAQPWIKMFDRWLSTSGPNYVYASDFAMKTRAILTGKPQDCIGQKICSTQHISTDPDGNISPCATLSADLEWRYGNILEADLTEIMLTEPAQRAQNRKMDPHCVECKWQHVCHGGCMQRAVKFYGTHNTRDYYCPSLYAIYEHIESKLREQPLLPLAALPTAGRFDHRPPPPDRSLVPRSIKHKIRHVKTPFSETVTTNKNN